MLKEGTRQTWEKNMQKTYAKNNSLNLNAKKKKMTVYPEISFEFLILKIPCYVLTLSLIDQRVEEVRAELFATKQNGKQGQYRVCKGIGQRSTKGETA